MRSAEPALTSADEHVWRLWCLTARAHARTDAHRKRVDEALRASERCLAKHSRCAVMWSGGKDSTAMAHLIRVGLGADVEIVSEKDDLDYPGEEEYVTGLAATWGARLRILRPEVSPQEWLKAHVDELELCADMHSRAAGLSKACFYGLVEEDNKERDAIFLGLRAAESAGRKDNREKHGLTYRRRNGLVVCQPLADWSGLDVYAYLLAHDVPVLPVYRCVAFMHAREPWRVRKSWWLPTTHGGVAWLRHYWPTLFDQMCQWIPLARRV